MTSLRFNALELIQKREITLPRPTESPRIPDFFGINVFGEKAMQQYLSRDTLKQIKKAIESGDQISRGLADSIAGGMKTWAIERGATHYTHWFQPLTGSTAEKHDSFFEVKDGQPIEVFSSTGLVQQEPDASSFPSGGIRTTFEARGYTAWDPSSPAFLMESRSGTTLCIPTIFVSYTGEALDFKAPLLRASHMLESIAAKVCRYFEPEVKRVTATLGIEQEYFLVDAALFKSRPDMLLTGRTLVGHEAAKGQQLEDHYFGAIPERVKAFMIDFENESYKLGIPLRTRHNEVAPGQYECAPQFEEVNLAVDHNQLLMDVMEKVARRHHFKEILHEKPFAGVNGSGKHCNWSMGTDTGTNLLSPGDTPESNLQFLTFFINTIKAVHDHADLLRASIASANNDHRLGANEAPPAIISVFIGSLLSEVIEEFIRQPGSDSARSKKARDGEFGMAVPKVPALLRDNTDRNRTSPFAFTGNKFEFRAVGSSANTAAPMMVLNTIVGNQLAEFSAEVEKRTKNGNHQAAILQILREYARDSAAILFEGNNYGDEWVEEAERRGLKNIKTTPEALDADISAKSIELFERTGVLSKREAHARHEIKLEIYAKQIQIESRILGQIALNQLIPAAVEYHNELLLNFESMMAAGFEAEANEARDYIGRIAVHISKTRTAVLSMIESRKLANQETDAKAKAMRYCHEVKPHFDEIKYHCDKLELYTDDRRWPLPKYRELMFVR